MTPKPATSSPSLTVAAICTALPAAQQDRVDQAHWRHRQLGEVHVGGDRGVALGVGDFVGMAVDGCVKVWRRAAMVGVRVPEHDPFHPAEPFPAAFVILFVPVSNCAAPSSSSRK